MSQPTFLPPDDETPPEPPSAAPAPAEQPPAEPPRPRRKLWPLAGAGAAALVAIGGVTWAIVGGSDGKKDKATYASAPSLCSAVPQDTLDRLVPGAAQPPTSGTYPSQRYTYCDWRSSNDNQPHVKRIIERGVLVAVRLHATEAAAKADFDTAWQGALQTNGTTSLGTLRSDATTRLGGIGDQAFFTHRTAVSGLGKLGTAEETVRVRNAIVIVAYRGRDSNSDGFGYADESTSIPLDAASGRPPADTLAHQVVTALTSCTTCRARS
ncbi:hypothetical protein [Actinomadura rupiterrae]|uniref:hypothetical protein n=1 Tax=Actinomadura rupiterrae TaxID=559627 RepID=UPI0020A4208F|nr:hypothetical protein [Actinomadura rupiterrae]MCP2343625.1 hypothetical protein [Actinomadura rupiterrae]